MSGNAETLVRNLVQQVQLLASLHWLSSLQVLASIPLGQAVAIQDVADVLDVPFQQLLRVIRTAATGGVLNEPYPGHVQHTPLSAQFIRKPFLSDAVTFLGEIAAPAALQMGEATRLRSRTERVDQTAYNLAVQSDTPLSIECERHPILKRKVAAYQRLRHYSIDESVTETLSCLDWSSLGDATVVQVGSRSTATARALQAQYPRLRFIIQTADENDQQLSTQQSDPQSRIRVQFRARGDLQLVDDAQVYIVYLPGAFLYSSREVFHAEIVTELKIHFSVLRNNANATLILVTDLLPEPDMATIDVEAAARSHDLLLMQLANGELMDMMQLQELLTSVGDEFGRFAIADQVVSPRGSTVVLRTKIEEFYSAQL